MRYIINTFNTIINCTYSQLKYLIDVLSSTCILECEFLLEISIYVSKEAHIHFFKYIIFDSLDNNEIIFVSIIIIRQALFNQILIYVESMVSTQLLKLVI